MEELYKQLIKELWQKLAFAEDTTHKPNGDLNCTFEFSMYCNWDVFRGPMSITLNQRTRDILITTTENHNFQPWDDGSPRIGTTMRNCSIKTLQEGLAVINHFINITTDH